MTLLPETQTSLKPHARHRYTDKYFVIPAIIWVAVTTQIPFLATIVLSLMRWNLVRPDQGATFNWFNNYAYFFWENARSSPEFWSIVLQTLQMTAYSLAACSVFGFLVALMLDHRIPLINVARTLVLGPFFVMSTTTGVIWKVTILNMTFGWYARIANMLGLPIREFISESPVMLNAFLFTWQWMPFFVLIILGGLQSVSGEVLESADLDGCNWFDKTFRIKLPMIVNHIGVAIMLGLIFLSKEYGLILVTTQGGPGKSSYTLAYYIRDQLFSSKQVGRAAAISVVMVALMLILINFLYRKIQQRIELYD